MPSPYAKKTDQATEYDYTANRLTLHYMRTLPRFSSDGMDIPSIRWRLNYCREMLENDGVRRDSRPRMRNTIDVLQQMLDRAKGSIS